jgi:cytochrome b561/polyisoprenoid-binding protein YceI
MSLANTPRRWGLVSQLLHWAVVALIVTQFVLAELAEDLPIGLKKLSLIANHKSFGITILALALVRLVWRRISRGPALPDGMSRLERIAANASHHLLYGLLFAVPLAGWAMSSAKNYSVSWFNLVPLPNLVAPNDALFEVLKETHEVLAWLLAAVAIVHALAALRHHFLLKDDVLRRMLPFAGALAAVVVGGSLVPALAEAKTYTADPAKSTVGFTFLQAGAKNSGQFDRFTVTLDLATPASGRLDVSIDVASLNTKDKDRDATLRGADLFDVAKQPRATFTAPQLKDLGGGKFEAAGTLTIRGVAKPVTLPLTLRSATEGGQPVYYLDGRTTVRRLDFGVGQGDWKSTEWVGNDVDVTWSVRLVPTAAPAAATAPAASPAAAKSVPPPKANASGTTAKTTPAQKPTPKKP